MEDIAAGELKHPHTLCRQIQSCCTLLSLQTHITDQSYTPAPGAVTFLCSVNNSLQKHSKAGKAQGYSHQFLRA